jgi:hypothetical protein
MRSFDITVALVTSVRTGDFEHILVKQGCDSVEQRPGDDRICSKTMPAVDRSSQSIISQFRQTEQTEEIRTPNESISEARQHDRDQSHTKRHVTRDSCYPQNPLSAGGGRWPAVTRQTMRMIKSAQSTKPSAIWVDQRPERNGPRGT